MKEKFKQHKRGIYLLPNLFTTASLFAAFYSIVSSMHQQFEIAAIAIFIGMITDSLDGRVARITNTQTAFGAEYDSLSDMVTFGIAPSLLAYNWSLHLLGKFGWLVAFVYTASVALRLARFNTQLGVSNKRYFQGLACPSGAAIIASLVWVGQSFPLSNEYLSIYFAIIAILIATLMVSNIRYHSFKDIDVKGKVPFLHILLLVIIFVAIALNPAWMILITFSLYALSGPILTLIRLRKVKKREKQK